MTDRHTHPSELDWARHLSREGSFPERRRLRLHLARCPDCRAFEAEQRRAREAFENDPRTAADAHALQAQAAAGSRPGPWRAGLAWLGALGATAALAGVVLALRPVDLDGGLLAKGSDVFTVHVDRPGGPARLGSRCAPGDRLMASYRTDHPYLLVLERDGRGAVQVLFPPGGTTSGRLPAGEGTTPTSWVLDGVEGEECFAAFFSDAPLSSSEAAGALAVGSEVRPLPGVTARAVCCRKEAR